MWERGYKEMLSMSGRMVLSQVRRSNADAVQDYRHEDKAEPEAKAKRSPTVWSHASDND